MRLEADAAFGGAVDRASENSIFLQGAGLNTLLQTLFGTRLPAVIGGSYTFVAPTISIILASRFSDQSIDPVERFKKIMRAIQGAFIVASTVQIVLGFSGLWRNVTWFLSPLSAVPLVALAGFGLYELAFPGVRPPLHYIWFIVQIFMDLCVEIGLPELIYLSRFNCCCKLHSQ